MTENEVTLALIALLFLGCFLFAWRGWARAIRINSRLTDGRDHWKRNYDIVESRLVRLERYLTRLKFAMQENMTPALLAAKTEVDRVTDRERQEEPCPWINPPPDTAAKFKLGHVAPDGTIWSKPNERVSRGVASIPRTEREKAERYGWRYIHNEINGRCLVEKP